MAWSGIQVDLGVRAHVQHVVHHGSHTVEHLSAPRDAHHECRGCNGGPPDASCAPCSAALASSVTDHGQAPGGSIYVG
jgi:hypothetical protein